MHLYVLIQKIQKNQKIKKYFMKFGIKYLKIVSLTNLYHNKYL